MNRTTIMLPLELKAQALRRARSLGISFGELVRESLAATLTRKKGGGDSLLADSAIYQGKTPADLSAEHDRYLYGDEP